MGCIKSRPATEPLEEFDTSAKEADLESNPEEVYAAGAPEKVTKWETPVSPMEPEMGIEAQRSLTAAEPEPEAPPPSEPMHGAWIESQAGGGTAAGSAEASAPPRPAREDIEITVSESSGSRAPSPRDCGAAAPGDDAPEAADEVPQAPTSAAPSSPRSSGTGCSGAPRAAVALPAPSPASTLHHFAASSWGNTEGTASIIKAPDQSSGEGDPASPALLPTGALAAAGTCGLETTLDRAPELRQSSTSEGCPEVQRRGERSEHVLQEEALLHLEGLECDLHRDEELQQARREVEEQRRRADEAEEALRRAAGGWSQPQQASTEDLDGITDEILGNLGLRGAANISLSFTGDPGSTLVIEREGEAFLTSAGMTDALWEKHKAVMTAIEAQDSFSKHMLASPTHARGAPQERQPLKLCPVADGQADELRRGVVKVVSNEEGTAFGVRFDIRPPTAQLAEAAMVEETDDCISGSGVRDLEAEMDILGSTGYSAPESF